MTFDPSTLTQTGQEIYAGIAPLVTSDIAGYDDSQNGFVGAILSGAIAAIVDPVSDLVRDQADGTPGYAILFEPENPDLPAIWLPWVAQFVGDSAAVSAATDEATARSLVASAPNFNRGRPATIASYLLSTVNISTVTNILVIGSPGGVPFTATIVIISTNTSDGAATAVQALAKSIVPAWIALTVQETLTEPLISALETDHTPISAVESAYLTIAAVEAGPV